MNLINILKLSNKTVYINDTYKLIGIKIVLLEFENEMKIITDIENKSLKNAIIDYISYFVEFKEFII